MTTSRQAQLLTFIRERIAATEVCPSYEEVADHLGLASRSGVYELIRRLEEQGRIRRLPDRARAIEVVDAHTHASDEYARGFRDGVASVSARVAA